MDDVRTVQHMPTNPSVCGDSDRAERHLNGHRSLMSDVYTVCASPSKPGPTEVPKSIEMSSVAPSIEASLAIENPLLVSERDTMLRFTEKEQLQAEVSKLKRMLDELKRHNLNPCRRDRVRPLFSTAKNGDCRDVSISLRILREATSFICVHCSCIMSFDAVNIKIEIMVEVSTRPTIKAMAGPHKILGSTFPFLEKFALSSVFVGGFCSFWAFFLIFSICFFRLKPGIQKSSSSDSTSSPAFSFWMMDSCSPLMEFGKKFGILRTHKHCLSRSHHPVHACMSSN